MKDKEKVIEFKIEGCIFTGEKEVTMNELHDTFVDFCENKNWQFCGVMTELD
jgi:hypothetical protein